MHRDKARFCHAWGRWLLWDGNRWKLDEDGGCMRLATQVAEQIAMDVAEKDNESLRRFATSCADVPRLDRMVRMASCQLPVSVDQLDQNEWLLNCVNGTVDLRTGELHQHDSNQYFTQLCPTSYDESAEAPEWQKFLDDIFRDEELIAFVQRLMGYCLTGSVAEHVLPIFHGSGANGKSTLLNTVMDVLGTEYTLQAMPTLLMQSRGDRHPTELASLFGKRLVSCAETEQGQALSESLVKSLTGGERVIARRMREDFWTFRPTHKLILSTNHKPDVRGNDDGIWRRLIVVPFLRTFQGSEIDKELPTRLRRENLGILRWLVDGCLKWRAVGLQPPDCVRYRTADYRRHSDFLGQFAVEKCRREASANVRFTKLKQELKRWCEENGYGLPNDRRIGSWLKSQGFEHYKSNGSCYLGITLLPSEGGTEGSEP
jgi:putative DNA primase/helicase